MKARRLRAPVVPPHRMRSRSVRRRDHGSATVLVLAVLGVLLVVAAAAFTLVGAVVASHRAHAAADLSALAGAALLVQGQGPGSACVRAAAAARRNDAVSVSCRAGADLSIEVVVSVPARIPGLGAASARARAGPAPPATER